MAEHQLKDPHVNKSGHLDVGDGHQIYYEDWGNPKAVPIMLLHGGPGAAFNDTHKWLFDPSKHRVILHDQRGCGRSTPFASTKNNTTQDLISDIEKLRKHLGVERAHVSGGSWGSTLSLVYAIAHPERVRKMMIWSVYLLRQFETDWITEGGPRNIYPEAWRRFISFVPEDNRENGTKTMQFYAANINGKNKTIAKKYAYEWGVWDSNLLSLRHDSNRIDKDVAEDPNILATATLELHYFLNNCFLPDNYILQNIDKIKHIPCFVVQGRFDMCTPPISAIDLAEAYGKNLTLQIVNAGHLRTEPENLAALRAIAATALI